GAPGAPQRTPFRVLVENLSSSVSWQDLKDFARRAGEVSFADAHKRRPGEGIVEFTDESGLRNAIRKLDGEDLRGRRIVIRESMSSGGGRGDGRPPRDRSYGRRSRSRSPDASYGRRSSYRSRSPERRRVSRSRSPYRSPYRSPPGSRSLTPRRNGDDGMPPPPPPHHTHDSPISPRQPLSPRSPSAERNGNLPPQDDGAPGSNDNWE
ncbi:Serine/arginine-rich splicing factor 6, partial [Coemansia sp. RSA 1933]